MATFQDGDRVVLVRLLPTVRPSWHNYIGQTGIVSPKPATTLGLNLVQVKFADGAIFPADPREIEKEED
jgi:hypothetical protein